MHADPRPDEQLAVICHDFHGTLAPLMSWLQVLQRGEASSDELHHAAEVVERSCEVLSRLARDLTALVDARTSAPSLTMAPLDLRLALRSAVKAYEETARRRDVALEVELPELPVQILGDRVRLAQVFSNLLENALKFTPPSGMIVLALRTASNRAVVTITDTGVGISPEALPHVFERSFREGRRERYGSGGSGFGLYIVKRLIEAHGGCVNAESAGPGAGTCFTVKLPLMAR
jgi:signal transduction histidine kinase